MDAGEGESSVKRTYGTLLVIIAELPLCLSSIMSSEHAPCHCIHCHHVSEPHTVLNNMRWAASIHARHYHCLKTLFLLILKTT